MEKVCIIFGGAGYIGTHLLEQFAKNNTFDKLISFDINPKPFRKVSDVEYIVGDVRKPIFLNLNSLNAEDSWVFNLAAIHREPGHESKEYYETNLLGAEHINSFLETTQIQNLYFTSSIAPYGESREQKRESNLLQPKTPYGISKALAEKIHQIWSNSSSDRRLIIARPSVIFGPRDPGNVLRMVKAIQGRKFFFPGSDQIVKAYGYIYGLVDSVLFTMEQKNERLIIYNYTENPLLNLGGMVAEVKKFLNISVWTPRVPLFFLVWVARIVQLIGKPLGKVSSIHPVRVKKAAFPTHIYPEYLIKNNFEFKYPLQKALEHWKVKTPEDFT